MLPEPFRALAKEVGVELPSVEELEKTKKRPSPVSHVFETKLSTKAS